ncbi:MAG TPA: tRNA (adenosine(37)-N6)-dimethylallyltransferase MiaA [Gemmatimonadaceae bacterium]|nr:tRNA (adenosine(37)-N6)-dimethylallyltransferase MiaA [Gemmatimonadaceae bacterium]
MSSKSVSADNSLRIIVGPTAAGKSALAMMLAERFGAAIVSADSRQIYRGFDIGTAKPGAEERARVPHYGIDVADPTERWSAVRFATSADEWLADIAGAGQTPVVVGGTGFWISALVAPLHAVPDLDEAGRDALERRMAVMTHDELRAWCQSVDPPFTRLGPAQWRRAIMVTLLTGRTLTEWHESGAPPAPRAVRYLVIDPGPAIEGRIADRVDAMLRAGWMDEVRALRRSVPRSAIAWKSCGYEQLAAMVDAGVAETDVRGAIIQDTRQYARRQRTWFRRQLRHGPVTLLDPSADDAAARATAWWNGEEAT